LKDVLSDLLAGSTAAAAADGHELLALRRALRDGRLRLRRDEAGRRSAEQRRSGSRILNLVVLQL